MPAICFSYPADMPTGIGDRNNPEPNLPDPRKIVSYQLMCFSYPEDVPQGTGNRDTAQSDVPGLRRMPIMCFRY